ncbi:RNA-directed DNA polymerase, eukaryota, reverse transcriptase zinc-binding domain protein [Tanacetum coccineum]
MMLIFGLLETLEIEALVDAMEDDEIKKALFGIDDNKAPGPDGYTSKFFKRSWDIVKSDFCATIKEFFSLGKLLGEVKATLISLVPKTLTPLKMKTRVLLSHRRAITYNILLTQELLKGYNCINGPKRCSFKIDIQKAYNTVSWSFIENILGNFGFPTRMIKWIMTCISTPKFTICVNGERYGYFKGGRGLRQGDPISLYIFTMVMEILNLIVKNKIRKDNTFKYHFGCTQLKMTHLCFANDLIMLSHGDKLSVTVLRNALNKVSVVSGLYLNLNKCTMFCGSLDDDTRSEINSIFPFKEGKLPVRYLRVPLVTKKIGVADCKQLVDKKLFKRFLWNSRDSCKGKAKVAWKEVCQGGLGFKSLELWNKSLLVKHLWNVASRKESLWVKWINVVKLKKKSVWDIIADSKDSWGWKCLLNFISWIGDHMRYRIGDGNSINIWHDKWHEGLSLSSLFSKKEIFYASFKDYDKIKDVVVVTRLIHIESRKSPTKSLFDAGSSRISIFIVNTLVSLGCSGKYHNDIVMTLDNAWEPEDVQQVFEMECVLTRF